MEGQKETAHVMQNKLRLFGIYLPISGHWVTEEVIDHVKFVLLYYYKALVLCIFPIGIRRPLNEEGV